MGKRKKPLKLTLKILPSYTDEELVQVVQTAPNLAPSAVRNYAAYLLRCRGASFDLFTAPEEPATPPAPVAP